MALLNRGNRLLIVIPAALIVVAVIVAVFLQVRRPANTRGALYIIGNPVKGAALFFGDKQCQLERLQRQRRGETVPPPLNINLERRR